MQSPSNDGHPPPPSLQRYDRNDPIVNLMAGGIGGTVGATITCPLDVVQTRLQSSNLHINLPRREEVTQALSDKRQALHERRQVITNLRQSRKVSTVNAAIKDAATVRKYSTHTNFYTGQQGCVTKPITTVPASTTVPAITSASSGNTSLSRGLINIKNVYRTFNLSVASNNSGMNTTSSKGLSTITSSNTQPSMVTLNAFTSKPTHQTIRSLNHKCSQLNANYHLHSRSGHSIRGYSRNSQSLVSYRTMIARTLNNSSRQLSSSVGANSAAAVSSYSGRVAGSSMFGYMQHMIRTEGYQSLVKGLGPNVVGTAPTRALYFVVYSQTKSTCGRSMLFKNSSDAYTHMTSAWAASWSTSTITNPIWFLKTQLQLDTATGGQKKKTVAEIISRTWQKEGLGGFYRGLSASYVGALETMFYFVMYERLKMECARFRTGQSNNNSLQESSSEDAVQPKQKPYDYVVAALVAKIIATVALYPHEVVRTRLRQQDQRKYSGFVQTLVKVYKEEGRVGMYGGMGARLVKQVPNTVIMFLTYEMVVNSMCEH